MPAHPRCALVDESEVGYYHCVARCVRRAFLCGNDLVSGQNFDHRRTWIRDRLEALAASFGIEVISFAVMSNHLHVILRTRPDVDNDFVGSYPRTLNKAANYKPNPVTIPPP
jgi:REP element-mobilizing transposase RayT